MNPAFGQQRRRVAELGRALAAVERQLDALHAELQRAQEAVAAAQESPEGEPKTLLPGATSYPDAAEMASGWQQRFRTAQDRLQQAQERRQVVLAELSGETEHQRESFGRRGLEVLEQAKELQRLTQEIRSTQAELRSLNAEAARAGLPPEERP
jgi:DNA repair exonuclease SbcCD ATPase subunit